MAGVKGRTWRLSRTVKRDEEIARDRRSGLSAKEIAAKHGVTETTVYESFGRTGFAKGRYRGIPMGEKKRAIVECVETLDDDGAGVTFLDVSLEIAIPARLASAWLFQLRNAGIVEVVGEQEIECIKTNGNRRGPKTIRQKVFALTPWWRERMVAHV